MSQEKTTPSSGPLGCIFPGPEWCAGVQGTLSHLESAIRSLERLREQAPEPERRLLDGLIGMARALHAEAAAGL